MSDEARLYFGLLGPLLVGRDEVLVPIPVGRQRALLVSLLFSAGQVVSADELTEVLWGPRPPVSARPSLHNYVCRLRTALGDSGRSRILTQPPGYTIRVDPDELDLSRFEALLRGAGAAARAGSWGLAAAQARAALSLWRGNPLADVESDVLARREIPRLAEMRLQALEARLDAELHLGAHAEMILELRRLVTAHPLREQLHGLLMLALYRCGRQAEALDAYRGARHVLVEELGIEPGTGLRELHQRILNGDRALAALDPAARPHTAFPRPGRRPCRARSGRGY
jgi:DNA-binding SARP family transcriptional activator